MNYQFTIPQSPQMTVKELLEDYSSFPVRSGIFTDRNTSWSMRPSARAPFKGDQIQLIFDADDYPERAPSQGRSLVEELYQDRHVIIVNKPEGMKTQRNEPTEIALLNPCSQLCWIYITVVHRLNKKPAERFVT